MTNPLEFFRKDRSDLSNFLIHLTKDGTFEEWKPADYIKDAYLYGASTTLNAKDSLETILKSDPPKLMARAPFGIFKLIGINVGKTKKKDITPTELKCVCFSETPLRELSGFYKATQDSKNWSLKANKYKKYGLAFDSSFIRQKNGHPIFYYDRGNANIKNAVENLADSNVISITRKLLPFFEPYGPKYLDVGKEIDFRWEREWRINGDLIFNLKEVAFGICPEAEISHFQSLVKSAFPFIDPDWDLDKLKKALTDSGHKNLADKI